MYIAVLLPSIFALFALARKKVTIPAGILAWICGIIITYTGGIPAFIALALTFILTILSDKLKKNNRDGKRTIYQIISNVLTCTLCLIIYYFKKADIFYVMYYAVLASSLSDTLASSIGSLSKNDPINLFKFKRVEKGSSGGISFLGITASILGGIIIGLVYYYVTYNTAKYLIIIIMGLLGSLIDSILGITIQGKYKCSKCSKIVENKVHCHTKTILIQGFAFVNNDVVNLLNNIIVFIITYLYLK